MIEDNKSSWGEQLLISFIFFILLMFISAFMTDASLIAQGSIQLIYSLIVLIESWRLLGTNRIFKKHLMANKQMITTELIMGIILGMFVVLEALPFHFYHSSKVLIGAGILALASAITEEYIFRGLFTAAIIQLINYYNNIKFKMTVTALITSFLNASLIALPYILGMINMSPTNFYVTFGLDFLLALLYFCVRIATNALIWVTGLHFIIVFALDTVVNTFTGGIIVAATVMLAILSIIPALVYLNLVDHRLLSLKPAR
ncbi:hypothetical protein [Lentilactobacillus kisonensis]|uniref:CAAX amino terminal protease family protein n=1 Tax=Lentilactobacillus kisonensis F0435 TaxID=797516 RepID=H1LJU4_9LACO|nr:hypothetical protein [Lentilactobacillus kisonensis]EHO48261.1 CAAX amino terminal protease family protein [Lentilactobacillus kisonensis F0435]